DAEGRRPRIADGEHLGVGHSHGDVAEAYAGRAHGNLRLYAIAVQRNRRWRIGRAADKAEASRRDTRGSRRKTDSERKTLACGEGHGTGQAADSESGARDGDLRRVDARSPGIRQRNRLRSGTAQQG